MESYRKIWMKQQTELRELLTSSSNFDKAIQLFLSQHAMLHSASMAQTESWSFADEILADMSEEQIRRIPQNCEHSVAWLIWHSARCEDITMNMLIAGSPQILSQENWFERLKITAKDTGNAMTLEEVAELSTQMDLQALGDYRMSVGRRTRTIVKHLQLGDLQTKVDPARIQQVKDEGAVLDAASYISDYWSKRTFAGLLLMPATRHNFVHLNEAARLKKKRQ
jgi:hypothetical protein